MILESIDFIGFYRYISDIFTKHFFAEEMAELMDYVDILSDANFRCYKANMTVIAVRKKDKNDHKTASEMEWVARNVGESRVFAKAEINRLVSKVKSTKPVVETELWMSDDVVYSIGEMVDRLSIEFIKREAFTMSNEDENKTTASQKLSDRVEKYLKFKLKEIDRKGFYECVEEQRTYNLDGIEKELAI